MFILVLLLLIAETSRCNGFDISRNTCILENNVTLKCSSVPKTIPKGILSVNVNFDLDSENKLLIKSTTFVSSNWNKVKMFELNVISYTNVRLQDNCFHALVGLEELRLHVIATLSIAPNAFVGLNQVRTLDLSSSLRVNRHEFLSALNGSTKLPVLKSLILSNFSIMSGSITVDVTFIKVLQSRKILNVDLSSSQLNYINATAVFDRLKYLETVNISNANIGSGTVENLKRGDVKRIKTVDASFIHLPKSVIVLPPGNIKVVNMNSKYTNFILYIRNHEEYTALLTPENINISGIVPRENFLTIENCSFEFDRDPNILTKSLTLRANNLKRLGVQLVCLNYYISSIQNVDISNNGLEFLHPGLLSCTPNLKQIDLSNNQLNEMVQQDTQLFEILFSGLTALQDINLSNNELRFMPRKTFENCRNIKVLDLSNNQLEQVHFLLKQLPKLRLLDLQGNKIKILDSISIANLNVIQGDDSNNHVTVNLKANRFLCSSCSSMSSVEWLLTTYLINISSQRLECYTEDGTWERMSEKTLHKVKKICARKTIILTSSVLVGTSVMILVIVMFLYYRRKRLANKIKHRTKIINLIQDGEGVYEFAVFLAFSNDDEDFVKANIQEQLDENLQLMTGIDRKLVGTGDMHFRPGFYVHNECFRSLDKASVMVVVVSNSFCASEYCQIELDQAYNKRKPIVLMMIEHVDVDQMPPTMKELFHKNVRIVWANENGRRVLKTTWENICTSILDLIT